MISCRRCDSLSKMYHMVYVILIFRFRSIRRIKIVLSLCFFLKHFFSSSQLLFCAISNVQIEEKRCPICLVLENVLILIEFNYINHIEIVFVQVGFFHLKKIVCTL